MGSEGKRTSVGNTDSLSSESTSSTTVSFLTLPRGIRNRIYRRVLFAPHPFYIFQEPGSRVETFAPEKPSGWLAILYTNRQIYHEASSALYGMNKFELVDITEKQVHLLRSFLDCIGPDNAASLAHLCINFPVVENLSGHPGDFQLRDNSLQSLQLVQDKCTNLSTLETLVHYKNSEAFKKSDECFQDTLSLVHAQFKAIPSLRRIIVRFVVHGGIPSTTSRRIMEGLGWEVISNKGSTGD